MRSSIGAIPFGVTAAFVIMSTAVADGGDVVFIEGDTPYLSEADSPWALVANEWDFFHLEDWELDERTPGISYSTGQRQFPGSRTDSVDADDGVIDGLGQLGHSYFIGGVNEFWLNFDAEALGGLPTRAGLVWTDGGMNSTLIIEAYDAEEELVGAFEVLWAGDDNFGGTTDEDRFYGVEFDEGISAMRFRTDIVGLEIDHIQYGAVPGPAGMAVLLGGLGLLGRGRRRAVR